MKSSTKLIAAPLVLFMITGILAAGSRLKSGLYPATSVEVQTEVNKTQPTPPSNSPAWLKGTADEKFAQIEKHLRGLDVAMPEIGYRYGELHFAARERNWEHAKYQTEKIDLTMRLALELRPKRAPSSRPFLNEGIQAVMKAIENKNPAQMNSALDPLQIPALRANAVKTYCISPAQSSESETTRGADIRFARIVIFHCLKNS